MKSLGDIGRNLDTSVTPFAGVWIEMFNRLLFIVKFLVTPFAGVWIEIYRLVGAILHNRGHSLRGSVD